MKKIGGEPSLTTKYNRDILIIFPWKELHSG